MLPNAATIVFSMARRWATHLGGSSTQNGRDSTAKRLGVKRGHGAKVHRNQILVRQRGIPWRPGTNVSVGRDHTLNATTNGIVRIERDHGEKRTLVHVDPLPGTPGRRDFILHDISMHINGLYY